MQRKHSARFAALMPSPLSDDANSLENILQNPKQPLSLNA